MGRHRSQPKLIFIDDVAGEPDLNQKLRAILQRGAAFAAYRTKAPGR